MNRSIPYIHVYNIIVKSIETFYIIPIECSLYKTNNILYIGSPCRNSNIVCQNYIISNSMLINTRWSWGEPYIMLCYYNILSSQNMRNLKIQKKKHI